MNGVSAVNPQLSRLVVAWQAVGLGDERVLGRG